MYIADSLQSVQPRPSNFYDHRKSLKKEKKNKKEKVISYL